MQRTRALIMGAAGRDFHNFNVFFRDNEQYEVVAFTATQIPNIEGRKYPASLAGKLYPDGIPIFPESELTDLIKKYQENIEFQKKKQNYLAKKTKNEIDEIFDKSNKIIENTIREIRESNADREKVKNARKELESEKKSINEKINNLFVDKDTSEDQKTIFNVGQLVKIKLTGEIGEIIRISDNQLTLVADNKILQINADAVKALNKKLENDTKRIKVNIVSRTENFSTTLDIRGNTVEDAINKLDKYLDQALLIGVPKVYIIHGKGYGILRKAVREYLKGFSHLLNFENEADNRGGDGITVISFKER